MTVSIIDPKSAQQTARLVARLSVRDVRALEEFHRDYGDRIFALARRLTGNDWDAEEVVQDVVWTVYRKADSFRGDAHFQRWVNRVTHNASLMLLRKRKRVPTPMEDMDIASIIGGTTDADIATRTEKVFEGAETLTRIRECLAEQDPVNRELFEMMDIQGKPKEEAARKLDLSIPALKARLHRVRHALKAAAEAATS